MPIGNEMSYKWKQPIYKVDATTAAREIESCRDEHGIITPASVVDRAAPNDNPIHVCFEWDNDAAAIKYREYEARQLIGNLVTVIRVDKPGTAPIPTRAFVNICSEDGRGYKPIMAVLQSPTERAVLLARAMAELAAFRQKYVDLSELATVFSAIDKIGAAYDYAKEDAKT